MPDNGYGAGLFNPQGPKDFATAVGGIAGSLKQVVAGFTTMGSQATDVIGGLQTRINKLCQEIQACKESMAQGWNVPSSATAGAPVGGSQSAQTSPQSGQGQPSTNQAGITPGAQWTSLPAGPGGGGTGSAPGSGVPQGTAVPNQGQFAGQGNVSPGGGGWNYPPAGGQPPALPAAPGVGAGGGAGGGVGGMGAQVAGASLPLVGKGLQSLLGGGLANAALQGNVVASQAQTWFGNGGAARGMEVMNGNMWAMSPQDYIQANYLGMSQSGMVPGTAGWKTYQGNVRTGQILSGGALTASQAGQASISQFSAQNTRSQLAFGIGMSPGGHQIGQQADFDKIIGLVFRGGMPSAAVMSEAFRSGAQMDIAAQQMLGVGAGDPLYIEFQNYAMSKAGNASQNKTMPNLSTASQKGLQQTGLWNQGMAQLKATSGKAQVESQALPTISDISTKLDNIASKLETIVNKIAGPLGGQGPGLVNSIFGGLGGGKAGGLLNMLPGASLGLGVASHIPVVGGLLKGLGFQEGGLVPGSGNSDSVPAMLTPGEYVIPKGKTHSQLASPGHQSSSSTVADLMVSKLNDLDLTTVAHVLFSPPARNTFLSQLLNQGAGGGAGAGGGGQGGSGGTNGGASGGTGSSATTSGAWSYNRTLGTGPQDLSGMYSSKQSSSSNGGTAATGAATGTGAGAATKLTGSGTAKQIWNFLTGKGLKDYMVAGIIGNMAQESGVNPESIGSGGGGLVGWTPLPSGLVTHNAQTDLLTQLNYLWSQLTGSESGAMTALQGTTNAADAATVFMNKFERPAVATENAPHRVAAAQNALNSKGAGFARGSQYIARTQLALLHRGEQVIPAADNYTSGPVYNRNGASSGGSAPMVYLNFKPGSIQLVVPPNSSQSDMNNIAQQFVKAISQPQVLAAVRST